MGPFCVPCFMEGLETKIVELGLEVDVLEVTTGGQVVVLFLEGEG